MNNEKYIAKREKDELKFNITKIYKSSGEHVCTFPYYCRQPKRGCKKIKWNDYYHDVEWE